MASLGWHQSNSEIMKNGKESKLNIKIQFSLHCAKHLLLIFLMAHKPTLPEIIAEAQSVAHTMALEKGIIVSMKSFLRVSTLKH